MATHAVCQRAAALLDHSDPFVRGLAEWAIAIRMGTDYELRRGDMPWPGEDAPAWFRKWEALDADALLDADYVRQAAGMGCHRTPEALAKSADGVLGRVRGLAGHVAREHEQTLSLAEAEAAARRLLEHVKASPDDLDLTGARKLWLALRRAARKAVLASPELDLRCRRKLSVMNHVFSSSASSTSSRRASRTCSSENVSATKSAAARTACLTSIIGTAPLLPGDGTICRGPPTCFILPKNLPHGSPARSTPRPPPAAGCRRGTAR
jgi:hypothetical protein